MSTKAETVCGVDGVEVRESRTGRLVHVDELPRGTDSDHEIVVVGRDDWEAGWQKDVSLRAAVDDMLQHHSSLCPWSACEFTERLAAAAAKLGA